MNYFLVSGIERKKKPVIILYDYISQLFNYGYKITKKIIKEFFSNDDMTTKDPKEIISYINGMKSKKFINKQEKFEILYEFMVKLYSSYSAIDKITFVEKEYIPYYVYLLDFFWTKVLQESNKFKTFHILGFLAKRNMTAHIRTEPFNPSLIDFSTSDLSCTNDYLMLESYLIKVYNETKSPDSSPKPSASPKQKFIKPSLNITTVDERTARMGSSYDDLGSEIDRELGLDN